ncbi:hypothetical protein [Amaricoccus solimangrovi]|uniref:Uncharacterized protein n=1 Tax=Amaricoccus solimangrovi TaxID=2589815 RepID=A0A501W739_9RHOB|nr:hypothetical protein [Amaricoccus solimangrovi]TPE45733.1 hypothetical protein FJM51_22335 [Amaricoccus solimangrovi]
MAKERCDGEPRSDGIWSIARGALPLALFGPDGYPGLMGRLAAPSLAAQAAAPILEAAVLARLRGEALLGLLAALAALNVAAVLRLSWLAASRWSARAAERV